MQVLALALEKLVIFDMQYDVQVAGRPAVHTGIALAGVADARSVLHPGGNFDLDRALTRHALLAFALGAGITDRGARAAARRTGARDGKESLLITDLAATAAGPAVCGLLARRGA